MNVISIYGSHDSSVCIIKNGEYRIFELEKFTGKRNACLSATPLFSNKPSLDEYHSYLSYIKSQLDEPVDLVLYNKLFEEDFNLINKILNPSRYQKFDHHLSHAACSYYQSPFDEALIVSFDGGGEGIEKEDVSMFNFYIADRKTGIKLIERVDIDLCTPYLFLAIPISEINKTENILPYSGKLMGLSPYGFHQKSLEDELKHYFYNIHNEKLREIKWNIPDVYREIESYNFAYMVQYTFETIFLEQFMKVWNKYKLPVCLSGGGALNVINNQKILNITNGKLFIPPNPNDCGLTFGSLVNYISPKNQIELLYNGFDILDYQELNYNCEDWLSDLINGKIIGFMSGRGEIGPRALGNRSIFCNPSFPEMKNILNSKVKFREWFRPFAPLIREKDCNKFFETNHLSRFMEFCPVMRFEYRNKLPAVLHVDNTSRVQTLTEKDNPYIYNILNKMEIMGHLPVILNTSFNIKGGSIINRFSDALNVFNNTQMDGLVINGKYIKK